MYAFKRLALIILIAFFYSKNLLSAEGMPQFNAETFPSQLFWLVITFVILYVCMSFIVLPRIRDNIRLRKNKITNDIERAELLKEQVDSLIKEYELKTLHARNKAAENMKSAIEKSNQDFKMQLDNVKKKITQKINKAEEEIADYKKSIENQLDSVSINISSLILEKVIGKSLSKSDIELIKKETSKMKEA